MDIYSILAKAFWCGWAALGFGILFNSPSRILWLLWLCGAIAGCTKFSLMGFGYGIVLSSFVAASCVGILSIPLSHTGHTPSIIIAIPSVIPLVPGVFAYRSMLGLMKLAQSMNKDYVKILSDTVHYGCQTLFIVVALAIGVTIPMHLLRQESAKNIRFFSRRRRSKVSNKA